MVDAVPPVRHALKRQPAQRLIQATRGARAVQDHMRFFALECFSDQVAQHRLRRGPGVVILRHRTRDVNIFNEIFGGTAGRLSYEPPREISRHLNDLPAPRILDLGANIGLFGIYALSVWTAASIRSFEPDPGNLTLLRETVAVNAMGGRWEVVPVAVGNRAGEMSFESGLFADSHLVLDRKPVDGGSGALHVPVVDLFAEDHHVDLMKMDIEGGEWAILDDHRLCQLGASIVVLEWHRYGCPVDDAVRYAHRRLREAGYTQIFDMCGSQHNGLLWARR